MHTYHITPVDNAWDHLITVSATAAFIGSRAARMKVMGDHPESPTLEQFLESWSAAQDLARQSGWEGDHRHEPVVFWVPTEGEFSFGFVIKQENNGCTFVISPVKMPWLDHVTI